MNTLAANHITGLMTTTAQLTQTSTGNHIGVWLLQRDTHAALQPKADGVGFIAVH